MKMVRKQLYLETRQDKAIKAAIKKTGETEAEFIRKAVDAKLESEETEHRRQEAWKNIQKTWAERKALALALGDEPSEDRGWTREELYDR
jgi:hypothetical protein